MASGMALVEEQNQKTETVGADEMANETEWSISNCESKESINNCETERLSNNCESEGLGNNCADRQTNRSFNHSTAITLL